MRNALSLREIAQGAGIPVDMQWAGLCYLVDDIMSERLPVAFRALGLSVLYPIGGVDEYCLDNLWADEHREACRRFLAECCADHLEKGWTEDAKVERLYEMLRKLAREDGRHGWQVGDYK